MKVVFLDRDGVINKFPGNGKYVTRVQDFHFLPGSLEAIHRLTEAGYIIFIISNQAGVGKGIYSQNKLTRITRKMFQGVVRAGGHIEKVYYSIRRTGDGCNFRKPGIGFIYEALSSVKKPLSYAVNTYFVGDTESDVQAGKNAGCKTIFVLSGREKERHMRKWRVRPDYIVRNLLAATDIILANQTERKQNHTKRARPTKG